MLNNVIMNKIPLLILLMIIMMLSSCFFPPPGSLEDLNTTYYSDDDDATETNEDQYEVDNSISQATHYHVGSTGLQNHTLHESADVDYLRFTAENGKTYWIHLSNIKGFEPEVTLYDSDKETMIEQKNTKNYTADYDWWGYNQLRDFNQNEKEAIVFTCSADGNYYVQVNDLYQAHNIGKYSIEIEELIILETDTSLTAVPNLSDLAIDLSWQVMGTAESYSLYYTATTQDPLNPNYSDFELLVSGLTGTSYQDTSISLNTEYFYYLTGSVGSQQSDPGNIANAELVVDIGQTQGLTAVGDETNAEIDLNWDELADVAGYRIYRTTETQNPLSPDYEQFTLLTTVNGTSNTSYSDDQVNWNTEYFYYVLGFLSTEEGEPSNIASAEIILDVGTTDTLSAQPNSYHFQIDLTWSAVTDAEGYYLYFTTISQDINNPNDSDFQFLTEINNGLITNYAHTDIDPDQDYYYYLTAHQLGVEGDPSNVATANFAWSSFTPNGDMINASDGFLNYIRVTLLSKYDHPNIIRYDVYRSDTNANYTNLVKVGEFAGDTAIGTYFDDGVDNINLFPDQYYYYCIKIIYQMGVNELESDYSVYDSGLAD
ncbi:MAG: pre-peptidase C-terminal domain-containing protein [Spirochaetes bacterium]|nr:pre-peptidase C-terminal domain-containing protein [Spirochaetota bacterium]